MGLTLKKIAAAKTAGRYGDGHGLYLQVGPTGTDKVKRTKAMRRARRENPGAYENMQAS